MSGKSVLMICFLFVLAGCGLGQTAEETPTAVQEEPTAVPPEPTAVPSEPTALVEEPTQAVEPTTEQAPPDSPEPALADLGPNWTAVEPGGDTRCAHDTPYTFWVRQGTSNNLLVFFEGGGGCWDAATCAVGSTFYNDDISFNDNPNNRADGILDLNNPENPFADYNMVFIPSCTGDVHWGANIQTYPKAEGGELTIYHHGYYNATAALEWAYTNITEPDSVFLTGCSAGSVGSITHSPYVIEQYPGARVTQLGDSLSFVFHRPVDVQTDYHAHDHFASWIPALQAIQPGELLMADYYTAVANYYPDYTFSQYNTEADNVQERFYTALGGTAEDFPAALAASLSSIHQNSPNFRSYTADGSLHCILPRLQFYSREVGGVRLLDWVTNLANGNPVSSVRCDTCQNEIEE